jgi:hypothetical protein
MCVLPCYNLSDIRFMARQDSRITGNAYNEERETLTGQRVRGLGPGPKWATERKDARVLAAIIGLPVLVLLIVLWLRH